MNMSQIRLTFQIQRMLQEFRAPALSTPLAFFKTKQNQTLFLILQKVENLFPSCIKQV
jgi:hypothetical protein